jgi:lipoprotein-anchoring transpeptidase ErfK/SrfK
VRNRKPVYLIAAGAVLIAATAFTAARSGADLPAEPAAAAPGAGHDNARQWYPRAEAPMLALPGGQTKAIQSVLNIRRPMKYGDFVWDEKGVPEGPLWVRADLDRQIVSVFRGGNEIGTAVILYGADSKPTPAGVFPVLEKAADYHSRTYDAPMPFTLRLTADGVAIHGSDVRERAATHGCIGVPLEFARRLFSQMQVGDEVFVLKSAET